MYESDEVPERLLWVCAPHFTAGAVWCKRDGQWICFLAAPILKWMVGLTAKEMRERLPGLEKKGWHLEWISPKEDAMKKPKNYAEMVRIELIGKRYFVDYWVHNNGGGWKNHTSSLNKSEAEKARDELVADIKKREELHAQES